MKKHLLAAAITVLAAGSALAQANDTLAKIKSSGAVTLGVRESSGLGLHAGQWQVRGFSHRDG
jgi:glutamate/aspartate transport system substrate-binding protein